MKAATNKNSMDLIFHKEALLLMGIQPDFSEQSLNALCETEKVLGIHLPDSLREWLCLDEDGKLFTEMTQLPHSVARLTEIPKSLRRDNLLGHLLVVIVENQAVWHMAISLQEGSNPPVYISYNGEDEHPIWELHADSLSNAILAFAWDYTIIKRPDYPQHFVTATNESQVGNSTKLGPVTFVTNAWFVYRKFFRYQQGEERFTMMLE